MSRIIRVIIQKSLYQNINRKRLTIVNLFSIYILVQRFLNYYPNYSTHRLYFGEVEAPYSEKGNDQTNVHAQWLGNEVIMLV